MSITTPLRRIFAAGNNPALLLLAFFVLGQAVSPQDGRAPQGGSNPSVPAAANAASAAAPTIVFGFVGGFVRHDDPVHGPVQLAARLRKDYPAGMDVEVFENSRGEEAHKKILTLLDPNHQGFLTMREKLSARIVLYGHSWGASEVVALARQLEKDGIPVLLTVQVDSVDKLGQNDALIPANVAQAANFFQPDGLIHGQSTIRAADPSRTKIIGNFRFDYKASPYACRGYPWYNRVFMKTHTQIECDPNVWMRVENLIRAALRPKTGSEP